MRDSIVFLTMLRLPARTIASYTIDDTQKSRTLLQLERPLPVEYYENHGLDKYKKALLVHDDVRYTMGLNLIQDRSKPVRKSHIKMTGNWRVFGTTCDFKVPKMLRFKLVETV
ncbi:hypothetical protein Tco_0412862 [Tanacetum coccineum]